jgi:uncharacterized protein (DUF427 family)
MQTALTHFASPRFWECYNALPHHVQQLADSCFELLKESPRHPSLHFKHTGKYWSVRVGLHYRALGVSVENVVVWFWIGTHAEYDRLIA